MRMTKLLAVSVLAGAMGVSSAAFAQYGDSPDRSQVIEGQQQTTPISSVGQYIDDATITAKVKAELFSDSHVKALNVSVQTNDGTVQLSGTVNSSDQKSEAERDANRVDGVRSVQDMLQVAGATTQEQ
jgi:hyperosmotically inducible protein